MVDWGGQWSRNLCSLVFCLKICQLREFVLKWWSWFQIDWLWYCQGSITLYRVFFNHMTIMDLRIWNCVLTHSNYVGTVAKCSHTWFLNTVQIRFITTMQLCLPIIAFICSFEVDLAHIIRDLIKSEIF